jgi:peroxiredoxin Q/BCP
MSLEVGDPIPDFSLATDGGGTISSADLRGAKAVIYFYPKDDTPQCTKQAQAFRDSYGQFKRDGIKLVGISTDDVSRHDKFKAKYGLTFPLATDTGAELAQAFGVWVEKSMYGKKYMGLERSTFLVDANGVVCKVWRKVKVPGHVDEVLEAARVLG